MAQGRCRVLEPGDSFCCLGQPTHVWPYQVRLDPYDTSMDWQKVGRRLAELFCARKEQRELSLLLLDAEARCRG